MGKEPVVIAGGGVAGLSAAYRLHAAGPVPFVLYERAPVVGGYSRTLQHRGFRFDLGGHRFYTKKAEVHQLVERLIGPDFLTVNRVSRILFRGRFVNYPLEPIDALKGVGWKDGVRCALSYTATRVRSAMRGGQQPTTFEQWAVERFGSHLYEIFFKTYTEKTWGVPCAQLSADFAEQRIRGLSFRRALKDAVLRSSQAPTLVRRFHYPRYGFGQIPEALSQAAGGPACIMTNHVVTRVDHDGGRIRSVGVRGPDGQERTQSCSALVSSVPIDDLVELMSPAAPAEVKEAARGLRYRSLVIVLLTLSVNQVSGDHWIYFPSPDIGFCRLHEPKNWSPAMAPESQTAVVLEYFCQEGDERWRQSDSQLAAEGAGELAKMGLVQPQWVMGHVVVRLLKAYPIYDLGYRERLNRVREYLGQFRNLYRVGRNGTFLYTSSDHYIDMGLKAADNVLGANHNLDEIGREAGYAEG